MDQELLIVVGGLVAITVVCIGFLVIRRRNAEQGPAAQSHPTSRQSAVTSRSRAVSDQSGSTSPTGSRPMVGHRVNWLVGQTGDVADKTFHIGVRTVTLGRGVANYLQIGDETASHRHAMLTGNDGGMRITDLDSSNGTFVNDRELDSHSDVKLNDGDEIEIGDTRFIYRKTGDFENDALTHAKDVQASEQTETAAPRALGGEGGLREEIAAELEHTGGDYQRAADNLDLDIKTLKLIVDAFDDS